MTREFGLRAAKGIGDAHERAGKYDAPDVYDLNRKARSIRNGPEERLMDLFNNHAGRALAMDPRNAGRSGIEVILEAARDGVLQTRPFNLMDQPDRRRDTSSGPGVRGRR